eukprot:gene18403-22527_t
MLLRGFADALMMRAHQAMAFADNAGFLPPHHYDQVFTAHGVIMIFFVAMPFVTGFMNYVVPLQIGARDVAFPFLNNFSFWMTAGGAVLVMLSLFIAVKCSLRLPRSVTFSTGNGGLQQGVERLAAFTRFQFFQATVEHVLVGHAPGRVGEHRVDKVVAADEVGHALVAEETRLVVPGEIA